MHAFWHEDGYSVSVIGLQEDLGTLLSCVRTIVQLNETIASLQVVPDLVQSRRPRS